MPASADPIDFELVDMNADDSLYRSLDHEGVPIVMEFYFAGCPSCKANAANVARLARAHHGAHAQVVEVSIDCDDEDYRDWIAQHRPTWPVLNACDPDFARDARVSRYPTTIVLDAAHREAFRTVGVWSAATYRRIEAALSPTR